VSLTVYSKNYCANCTQTKQYLQKIGVEFCEVNIEQDEEARAFVLSQGHRTVPQIYMDGKIFVSGGWAELSKMDVEQILNEIELREVRSQGTL